MFNNAVALHPSRFITDPFHRCKGPSAPADIGVVYAVRSEELGPNGVLVGDCGTNAQDFIHKMVSALPAHEHADPMGRVLDAQGWTVEFMKRDKLRNPSDLHTSTAGKSVQYHLDAA